MQAVKDLAVVNYEVLKNKNLLRYGLGDRDCRFCGGVKTMVKTDEIKKTISKTVYEFEGYVCTCCGGCEIVQKI